MDIVHKICVIYVGQSVRRTDSICWKPSETRIFTTISSYLPIEWRDTENV